MKTSRPFIQSQYSRSEWVLASGSACAENVALGVQYAWHESQPFPASHASKNCFATAVIFDIVSSLARSESRRTPTECHCISEGPGGLYRFPCCASTKARRTAFMRVW